jgi:hypothetical protein
MGGLTLFAAQGCKAPKQVAEQAEHPNIIYVFPDQYRNQAMGFWNQEGFRAEAVHAAAEASRGSFGMFGAS